MAEGFLRSFCPALQGRQGIDVKQMAENDSVVGAIQFAVEMLVRQVRFEPASDENARFSGR